MDSGNVSLSELATSENIDKQDYFIELQGDVDVNDFLVDNELRNVDGYMLSEPRSLENHTYDAYDHDKAFDDPPIPQYDGNDSIDDATDALIVGIGPNNANIHTKTSQFELNQRKQTAGIYRDAQIEDFKVIHKDYSKNVNIECNSGFYAQVARPTLSTLAHDPIPPVLGYSIVCDNITKNMDAAGLEFNLTVFFRIVQSNGNSTKVTVHTHNSKRCVQVQGGSAMPDKSTSALWFVKNVLYGQFQNLAKAKSFSIAGFNQAITAAGNNPDKKCGYCDRNLDARSYPVNCSSCTKWFHKTNCHKAHRCRSTSNPALLPSLSISPSVSSSVTSLSASTASASSTRAHQMPSSTNSYRPPSTKSTAVSSPLIITSCPSNPAVMRTSASSSLSTSISLTSNSSVTRSLVITVPSSVSSVTIPTSGISPPSSSLNAGAPHFHPPPPQLKKAKQTQHLATFTPEKAEIESLKIQLSFARTKITDLETKNKDQEHSLNIYSQRIKLMHDSQVESLQEKYFPTKDSDSKPASSAAMSLDCDCKIRAQIVRNTLTIKDIGKKLSLDHDPISGLSHSSSVAVSPAHTLRSVPLPQSRHPPTKFQPNEGEKLAPKNQIQPGDVLVASDDEIVHESDHESDFDFPDSFEIPADSPRICLN